MRVSSWTLPAALLLADAHQSVAKAILSPVLFHKRNNLNDILDTIDFSQESVLDRRQTSAPASGSNSGSLKIGSDPAEVNATITDACMGKLTDITTVTNPTGFAGCYNILSFDKSTTQFQSDLRIYSKGTPSGQFAGIAPNDILVLLNFPNSTTFKTLTKRAEVQLETRQDAGNGTVFQQYSLSGSITTPIKMGKLTDVQMASLLTPQIKMQATSGGQTFSADMSTDDAIYFATGTFTELAGQAKEVSDPNTAKDTIAQNKGFVLPGTTFGIFPIGLIVTSAWTVLFVLAYGAGTIARFHYRSMYRKRVAYVSGRNYSSPGIGKL